MIGRQETLLALRYPVSCIGSPSARNCQTLADPPYPMVEWPAPVGPELVWPVGPEPVWPVGPELVRPVGLAPTGPEQAQQTAAPEWIGLLARAQQLKAPAT